MTNLKRIAIAIGVLVVLVVAWWLAGKFGLIAGGGGLLALLGLRRKKAPAEDALRQALDDGLEAKESQVEAEREKMKQQAADETATDANELEERANAMDPDAVPWRRAGRDN